MAQLLAIFVAIREPTWFWRESGGGSKSDFFVYDLLNMMNNEIQKAFPEKHEIVIEILQKSDWSWGAGTTKFIVNNRVNMIFAVYEQY